MSWLMRLLGQSEQAEPLHSRQHEPERSMGPHSNIDDDLYEDAIRYALKENTCSISALQRFLKIGYNRAARLLEAMEKDGYLSPLDPSGKRALLPSEHWRTSTPPKPQCASSSDTPGSAHAKSLPPPERVEIPALTGLIKGTTGFNFNVVGESHFQAGLRQIRNSTCLAVENEFDAFIVTEPGNPHDRNACAVYIDGFKVGYLPREAAAEYVSQMSGRGVLGLSCFQVRAKLTGGFRDRPNIGVLLNLPT